MGTKCRVEENSRNQDHCDKSSTGKNTHRHEPEEKPRGAFILVAHGLPTCRSTGRQWCNRLHTAYILRAAVETRGAKVVEQSWLA